MKKLIYLIVLTLILGLIVSGCIPVVPPTEQDESSSLTKGGSTTWTVGPSGPPTYHYFTIQEAIDAVTTFAGDTIDVAAGEYEECVVINKNNLTLLGAQHDVDPRPSVGGRSGVESIIAPYYDFNVYTGLEVVRIEADNVIFNGFTVSPEFSSVVSGDVDTVYQHDTHTGTVVKYNIVTCTGDITHSDEAIQLKKCSNGVIEYNYVYHTKGNGFNFAYSTDCTIRYNEAHDCGQGGVDTWDGTIYTYSSNNIEVIGNTIYSAHADGITFGGITGWPRYRNTGGTIKDNTIYNATFNGLEIYADNVMVENNEIYNCAESAIEIIGANVTVQNNSLHGNEVGISVKDIFQITSTDVSANWNNIEGNTEYGVKNEAFKIVDATCNWWGHPGGPLRLNPDDVWAGPKKADRVSRNVDYHPWLHKPMDN